MQHRPLTPSNSPNDPDILKSRPSQQNISFYTRLNLLSSACPCAEIMMSLVQATHNDKWKGCNEHNKAKRWWLRTHDSDFSELLPSLNICAYTRFLTAHTICTHAHPLCIYVAYIDIECGVWNISCVYPSTDVRIEWDEGLGPCALCRCVGQTYKADI